MKKPSCYYKRKEQNLNKVFTLNELAEFFYFLEAILNFNQSILLRDVVENINKKMNHDDDCEK